METNEINVIENMVDWNKRAQSLTLAQTLFRTLLIVSPMYVCQLNINYNQFICGILLNYTKHKAKTSFMLLIWPVMVLKVLAFYNNIAIYHSTLDTFIIVPSNERFA